MTGEELRKTIVVTLGLGAALYLEMTGATDRAGTVCTATLMIWFFFL